MKVTVNTAVFASPGSRLLAGAWAAEAVIIDGDDAELRSFTGETQSEALRKAFAWVLTEIGGAD